MNGLPFTDADGRRWLVIDYRTERDPGGAPTKKRVPFGSSTGEARAFLPDGKSDDPSAIMVFAFAWPASTYDEPDVLRLQQQLDEAFPSTMSRAERELERDRRSFTDRSAWRKQILRERWITQGRPAAEFR